MEFRRSGKSGSPLEDFLDDVPVSRQCLVGIMSVEPWSGRGKGGNESFIVAILVRGLCQD